MQRINYASHAGVKANPSNLPSHIAIIMDGNGRWAAKRGLSRTFGHRKGVETVRTIISSCREKGIQVLTLFAFGIENKKRPPKEVRNLFRLFFLVLKKDIAALHENGIQLRIIGDRSIFTPALLKAVTEAENLTLHNHKLILNVAINYSGRWDLLNAVRDICQSMQHSSSSIAEITEDTLSAKLALHGLPEPDLFIRTGGVLRISNFVLWELAYTELFFTETLWPDFDQKEFEYALENYSARERRFGLTGEQLESV